MSLRLILGNSGSGKSHYLYQHIIEAAVRSPQKKYLVIVPEQFTMQTQRELVRMHPDHGLLNIDILSFPRLAHRVFEEVGADTRTVLEETGKTLLLRRAALKNENGLKILKNNLRKPGYLRQMKSIISELTQYHIDADRLQKLMDAAKKASLYYKLQDIRLLYDAFREELSDRYLTAEETLEALRQVAAKSSLLRGSVIALDGFTGFTPIQNELLGELFSLAAEVYVTVTIASNEDFGRIRGEHELFYLSKKTIRTLTATAQQKNCEVEPPTVMEWRTLPRFAKSPALAHLEAHLFRSGKSVPFTGADDAGISLHTAENPVQEAHFAARTIRELTRQGWRYQDMAVIVGDMASYANYIPRVFQEYDIPCFMDSTRTVFSNPLIEFIRAALALLQQNFTCTAMFRWLRTGLFRLEKSGIDLLENYVLAAGVRGASKWSEPFVRKPDFLSEEEFEKCNELRGVIWEALAPFAACALSADTTVREKTEGLYRLLCHFQIQQQLAKSAEEFARAHQPELQKEFDSIYAIVIALFDKLAELLGAEKMSLEEYTQILEAGFEEARLRMIPPALDRIQVGDLERTRLNHVKVLFFLGLNDGWVPASGTGGGLLSDMERETLAESGVELAPTARQNSYIQKFYLYLNLTKPGERLFLSCSRSAADGSALRPSYVMRQVMRLFPGVQPQAEDMQGPIAERVSTPKNGLYYLIDGLRQLRDEEPQPEWLELYNWYRKGEGCTQAERLVEAAFLSFHERGIGKAAARALYGEMLANSVSRLERFSACAFAHFLQYGLRLSERSEYVFRPVDMGRIFHSAIERYAEKLSQDGCDWKNLPQEEQIRRIDACVEETARDYGQQILHDSARSEAVIGRIKRILRRTVWALHRQISAGRFVPDSFEVPFSQVEDLGAVNITLPGEERMKLMGRIDRIDICENERQVYVKVLDYKSGNTALDLTALYYGLQLQLIVYLNAAMEMEQRIHPKKEIVPAGVLYYHMEDPLLSVDGEYTQQEIERDLLRALRPDGLVNADLEILRAMDGRLEKSSDVIPVSINKDGSLSKDSRAATTEQFAALSRFVQRKLKEIGARMMEGEITPCPYQRKQQTACDYCLYRAVCKRDVRIPGTPVRRLREYAQQEIWELLTQEDGADTAQEEKGADTAQEENGADAVRENSADAAQAKKDSSASEQEKGERHGMDTGTASGD